MRILEQILSALSAFRLPIRLIWTWQTQKTGFVQPDALAFIEKFRPVGLEMEAAHGIPWRFPMVQSALESRFGLSLLTQEANNLFGITGDSWYAKGLPVWWRITKEYGKDGTPFDIKRPFRKYDSWAASLADWVQIFERLYPVARAAAMAHNFEGFARGLQTGGYASDPKYADELIKLNKDLEGIG